MVYERFMLVWTDTLTAVDLIFLNQIVPTNIRYDVNKNLMEAGSRYWTLAAMFVSMTAKSLIGGALFRIMGSVVPHCKFF